VACGRAIEITVATEYRQSLDEIQRPLYSAGWERIGNTPAATGKIVVNNQFSHGARYILLGVVSVKPILGCSSVRRLTRLTIKRMCQERPNILRVRYDKK
jgi:hypothetical protein